MPQPVPVLPPVLVPQPRSEPRPLEPLADLERPGNLGAIQAGDRPGDPLGNLPGDPPRDLPEDRLDPSEPLGPPRENRNDSRVKRDPLADCGAKP